MKTKPKPKKKAQVGIIYGDVHDPFCDEAVWNGLFLPALQKVRPDFIVELGDGIDFYALSPFAKDPARRLQLIADRNAFYERRKGLRHVLKRDCVQWYVPGTHEKWLRKYLWSKAPELAELPELQWYEFLGLASLGFDWLDFDGEQMPVLDIGHLAVTHGDIARKPLGASIRAMLDEYGQNILFNHTHRMGWLPLTNHAHEIGGWENGCLCRKDLGHEYIKGSVRWQQGWSVVTAYEDGDFRVHPIHVVRTKQGKKRAYLHEGVLEITA